MKLTYYKWNDIFIRVCDDKLSLCRDIYNSICPLQKTYGLFNCETCILCSIDIKWAGADKSFMSVESKSVVFLTDEKEIIPPLTPNH